MDTLNEEQHTAFQEIIAGKNVFLTGAGGTGKSYFIHVLIEALLARNMRVALTAMTGCAAILLSSDQLKAKTLHSWAGIGLGKESATDLAYKIRRNGRTSKNWLTTDLLIVDEISMMTPDLLEKLDDIGKKLRRRADRPFGGIQLLLVGDFFQLPPVVTKAEQQLQPAGSPPKIFAFQSPIWNTIVETTVELRQIKRQADADFQDLLTAARFGKLTQKHKDMLRACVGRQWQKNQIKPTLLFSRRYEVDKINQANLAALKGERHTYEPGIVFNGDKPSGITPDDQDLKAAVTKMDTDAAYVTDLNLTVGSQVMLIKNLDTGAKLVNGSRGVVTGFAEGPNYFPIVKFLSGQIMTIEEAGWPIDGFEKFAKRTQVPLRLAWAVTIHKSQGSTLDCALIDIGESTFEYGQAYVALSRVRDLESLYIHDFDPKAVRAHPLVLKEFAAAAAAAVAAPE
jgi:ATP-dependent DNA helicase PIF1